MNRALPVLRSKAWPRIPPTASSLPPSGYALLGLPGIVLYKAINTADSMIGHKSPRYLHFGWAAARLDDLVNLPASRLTGLLFAALPQHSTRMSAARRRSTPCGAIARNHVSPNAGWPEAALAGALGLQLGGPRSYGGRSSILPPWATAAPN